MLNYDKLAEIVEEYKAEFPERWEDEKFKWVAVKHFQENWDINAADFLDMFSRATEKTYNLLTSRMFFPRGMMIEFIKDNPEIVRNMFKNLFDESQPLSERIDEFTASVNTLNAMHNPNKNHYQTANTISTYLWLKYPDKYYIYKYAEYSKVARFIDYPIISAKSSLTEKIEDTINLYNELSSFLARDNSMRQIAQQLITPDCYEDKNMKIWAVDLGFYISRKVVEDNDWFPQDYSPNITVNDWVELLNNPNVFYKTDLEIMKRFKDIGNAATCLQLAKKYGETAQTYNIRSTKLAKRIAEYTKCPILQNDNENSRWWPILYLGKNADKDTDGTYVWKLRNELSDALDRIDLSAISLYAKSNTEDNHNSNNKDVHYWWLNANPKIWSFSNIAVGDEQSYTLYNDNGNKRRVFQYFLDAKPGDIIIGYESTPVKQIVALAKVSKEHDADNFYFEKTEQLASPIEYKDLLEIDELKNMEYLKSAQGSLFKLTEDEYTILMDIIRDNNPLTKPSEQIEKYSKEQFLADVYTSLEDLDTLCMLLKNKKNVILQGAPGVGKTYTAKRLAYAMMGEKDKDRIEMVQFHQNYTYEDFVMGYKPDGSEFRLRNGVFYDFCIKASNNPDKDYFFIIDEINRGNMSKIFGELLMLIEKDYRGADHKITLAYNQKPFYVPENLYIIGMMNTADRSLAMIDYALRRRFSFYEIEPRFASDGFRNYQKRLADETFDKLIIKIEGLNREIRQDSSLGSGFCIGHSYFCNQQQCSEDWLKSVVTYEIVPMLQEYWFDDNQKVQMWINKLESVFDD